jgi:predicted metal-dependent peptidase
MNQNESLAKVSKNVMLSEPYYGYFLLMLNKEWTELIPTGCVSIHKIGYKLSINPEFWNSLSPLHQEGLVIHELLHIAFFHLTEYDHLKEYKIRNYAMDLEINQYISKDKLPPGGLLLEHFSELKLEPKQGTLYYYEKLLEAAQNNSCPNLSSLLEQDGGEGSGSITVELPSGDEVKTPDHSQWNNKEVISEAHKKLIDSQTKHILNEIADQVRKSRGIIPGHIQTILDKINELEPPKFDWKGFLKRFAGNSVKIYTKKTRRKYNKRYDENPGLKIKKKKHVLVAIDTSGSVSVDELIEFMQEITHIYKTGTEVTVIHADTEINSIESFNPKKDWKINGRGGTNFQPVIDYYRENINKYTCLFYLTDGEAPAPENAKGKILWVMSSISNDNEELPGMRIKLN